jgi:alanine-glyoxylate transaminase / serine-glyoxylate transaminase / serine-pyruvate transaminase
MLSTMIEAKEAEAREAAPGGRAIEEGRLLMVPGPTNLSKRVRQAMSQPQVGHMDVDYADEFSETLLLARRAFRNNDGHQFILTGSGTIGMEICVTSIVSSGDKVLVLNTGYFGQRMVDINRWYGAKVEEIRTEFGVTADPDEVRKKLAEGGFKALFVTHVDTSTTVGNPIKEIVKEAKDAGAFAVVDGICSVGGIELEFDRLGADIVFTGSQKALAAPPGTVLLAVSRQLLGDMERRRDSIRGYYLDLLRWKPYMDDPRTYFATPAVQLMQALKVALQELDAEGLEARWRRHHSNAEIIREGIERAGSKLAVKEPSQRPDTVTGVWTRDGGSPEIQKALRERYNIDVAKGLGENSSKMLRVGHFGNLTEEQARYFVDSFREASREN